MRLGTDLQALNTLLTQIRTSNLRTSPARKCRHFLLPLCENATSERVSDILSVQPCLLEERGEDRFGPVALAVIFGRVDLLEVLAHHEILPELLELVEAVTMESKRLESGESHLKCQDVSFRPAHARIQFFHLALALCSNVAIVEAAIASAASHAFEDIFHWLTTDASVVRQYDTRNKVLAVSDSALLAAIDRGRLSCVKWLLDFGCDPANFNPHANENPLSHAIYNGHLKIVQLLIESGTHPIIIIEDRPYYAVHAACTMGQDHIAFWLFNRAVDDGSIVDVDCFDLLVSSAYLRSSSNSFAKAIVKKFPRLKDIGYKAIDGRSNDDDCSMDETQQILPDSQLLTSSHATIETVLDAAFKTGNLGLACALLTDETFAGITLRTHLNPSTLRYCLMNERLESVSLIVDYGEEVDVDAYNNLADEDGNLSQEMMQRLYLYNLVFDCFSPYCPLGSTSEAVMKYALQEAIKLGSLRLTRWLVEEAGVPVETDWIDDSPPLMALTNSRPDILDYFIDHHGVSLHDPRVTARGDGTVLHLAAARCHDPEMAKGMVSKLPHAVYTCNAKGETPLAVAAQKYNTKAIERLAAAGARLENDEGDVRASLGAFDKFDAQLQSLVPEDRERHFLDLVKRLHDSFGSPLFKIEHVPLAIRASLWRATEFLLDKIFPEYCLAGPEHLGDVENLNRIHGLFIRAAEREYPPLLCMLVQRFCLPEHIPPNLFYEHRFSFDGSYEEWETLYFARAVGTHLHRIPDDTELIYPVAYTNDYGALLECSGDIVSMPDLPPPTIDPILDACKKCDLRLLKMYVRYGASLERRSRCGATPLLVACSGWHGHLPIVQWLLSHGCSIFDTDYNGKGVLDYAKSSTEIRTFLQNLLGVQ